LRVCGDYSVTVNAQLKPHRYPMPSPEELMQRLSGGYCYYNQILTRRSKRIRRPNPRYAE
ncbi:hypothetical protein CAPTEDRAFT_103895, partial [Capitella teleta]